MGENGHFNTGRLSRRQERALSSLLCSSTVRGASKEANVSESSLRRWLKSDKCFIAAYEAARQQAMAEGQAIIEGAYLRAVRTLIALLADDEQSTIRLSAAKEIITTCHRSKAEPLTLKLEHEYLSIGDCERVIAEVRRRESDEETGSVLLSEQTGRGFGQTY